MIRTFVDSLFIVAVINVRDQYHSEAVDLAERYDGRPLLITDAVLLEVGNALARNHKPEAVGIIERFLSSEEVEVVPLSPRLFERAVALYKASSDKAWGLVDCASFVAMRDAGVTDALTCDRHFRQAGFRTLMADVPLA